MASQLCIGNLDIQHSHTAPLHSQELWCCTCCTCTWYTDSTCGMVAGARNLVLHTCLPAPGVAATTASNLWAVVTDMPSSQWQQPPSTAAAVQCMQGAGCVVALFPSVQSGVQKMTRLINMLKTLPASAKVALLVLVLDPPETVPEVEKWLHRSLSSQAQAAQHVVAVKAVSLIPAKAQHQVSAANGVHVANSKHQLANGTPQHAQHDSHRLHGWAAQALAEGLQ